MILHLAHAIEMTFTAVADLLMILIVGRVLYGAGRFLLLPREAKRHYPGALWHRLTWKRSARRLGLARLDEHRRTLPRLLGSTSPVIGRPRTRLLCPRASFRADPHGLRIRIRTIPGVDRESVEKQAAHLANVTGSYRVAVLQVRPARLEVMCLRREPLAEPLSADMLPAFDGRMITLGRDMWGQLRRVSIADHAGSVWAGSPGRGKSECALSLACQLAASPLVDLHVLDGGALDWQPFADGAASYVADDLAGAADLLADLDRQMRERRRTLEADTGHRNVWKAGLSEAYRLQWVLLEECPFFLSLEVVKGDKKREQLVAACRGFTTNLLRRGRAPGFHTSLITQRATTTNLPSDLRDLCGLRWSFGCPNTDSAVACLGEDIKSYDTLSPVSLQGPDYVGVACALLRTHDSPFTLLKFPEVGEARADRVALQLADRRRAAITPPASVAQIDPPGQSAPALPAPVAVADSPLPAAVVAS